MSRTRSAVVSGVLLLSHGVAAQDDTTAAPEAAAAPEPTYYQGSSVAGRNFPPAPGCTVLGKIYSPLTHAPNNDIYSHQNGWDWCQSYCAKSYITQPDGSQMPCAHFAYFPDGRCFLQDANAKLADSDTCNAASPCEHGFQVISGPATCANKSEWVDPSYTGEQPVPLATPAPATEAPTVAPVEVPTAAPVEVPTIAPVVVPTLPPVEVPTLPPTPTLPPVTTSAGPTLVGEGSKCNPTLPPQYQVNCEEGLICFSESGLMGASGVCTREENIPTTTTLPMPTVPPPPTVPPMEMPTVPPMPDSTTAVLRDIPTVPPVVEEAPPTGATATGFYYQPQIMLGSVKLASTTWKDCQATCEANPLCSHFGYWPDGSCTQQAKDATLVKAGCPEGEADCAGLKVISGPRDLKDEASWPDLGANIPTVSSDPFAAPGTVGASSPTVVQSTGAASGGGGLGLGGIIGLLVALAVVGAGGFWAYQNFLQGGDEGSEDEGGSEADSQAAMLSP